MIKQLRIWILFVAAFAVMAQTVAAQGVPPPNDDPKNVILFIGDGMGPKEVELAALVSGESLVMQGLPVVGTVDTNSASGVTDSAAAATALATGYETYNDMLSWVPVDLPPYGDPFLPETVLEYAETLEMSTGLITDLKIRSATPAAFACHVEDRDDDDAIVAGMAEKGIEVLFSGGFSESGVLTGTLTTPGEVFIDTRDELMPYLEGTATADRLFGFFGSGSLAYTLDIEEEGRVGIDPTLPELTETAINILSQNENGFFLMVEGGVIDYGGHARDAAWVVADTLELDQAVQVALDFAATDGDTLVVVTADHETGGLDFEAGDVNVQAIEDVEATVEWMWGEIKPKHGRGTAKAILRDYANVDLNKAQIDYIMDNKEMGIADILSEIQGVSWGWTGLDEGEHTGVNVLIFAEGPGAGGFAGFHTNEEIGVLLRTAVG